MLQYSQLLSLASKSGPRTYLPSPHVPFLVHDIVPKIPTPVPFAVFCRFLTILLGPSGLTLWWSGDSASTPYVLYPDLHYAITVSPSVFASRWQSNDGHLAIRHSRIAQFHQWNHSVDLHVQHLLCLFFPLWTIFAIFRQCLVRV